MRVEAAAEEPKEPLINRISTPEPASTTAEEPDRELFNTFCVEGGWDWYNPMSNSHYPVHFINDEGGLATAYFIRYTQEGGQDFVEGTMGPGKRVHRQVLQARKLPNPNFTQIGIKDSDLTAFHPSSTARGQVDKALDAIKDPGLTADIKRFRVLINEEATLRKRMLRTEQELIKQAGERTRVVTVSPLCLPLTDSCARSACITITT